MSRHDVKTETGASMTAQHVARSESTTAPGPGQPQSTPPGALLLRLQQRYGNQYVSRLVEQGTAQEGGAHGLDHVEQSIERLRGGGHGLDGATLGRMNAAFGADFSGVRIHTGAEAHELNRSVEAKAFATGRDIFFSQGAYSPGSSEGRGLLAHELTHVVQQAGPGMQMKLSVSQPDDPQEIEAERMAHAVVQQESGAQAPPALPLVEGAGAAVGRSVIQRDFAPPNSDDDSSALSTPVSQPAVVPGTAPPGAVSVTGGAASGPATSPASADQVSLEWCIDWQNKETGAPVSSTSNARTGKDATYGTLKVAPEFGAGNVGAFKWVNAATSGAVKVASMAQAMGKGGKVSSDIAWGKPPSAAAVVRVEMQSDGRKPAGKGQLPAKQQAASDAASRVLHESLIEYGGIGLLEATMLSEARKAVGTGDDGTTYAVSVELKSDPKATYSRAVAAQPYDGAAKDDRRTVTIAVPTEVQKLLGKGSVELEKWLRETDSSQGASKDADSVDKIDSTKTTLVTEVTKSFEAIFNQAWGTWKSERKIKSLGGYAQGSGGISGGGGAGGSLEGLKIDFGSVLALAFAEDPLLAIAVKKAVGTGTIGGNGKVDLEADLRMKGGIGASWSDDDLQQALTKIDSHVNQKLTESVKSQVETAVFNRTTKSHEETHAAQTGRDEQTSKKTVSSSDTVGVKYVIGEPQIRVTNG